VECVAVLCYSVLLRAAVCDSVLLVECDVECDAVLCNSVCVHTYIYLYKYREVYVCANSHAYPQKDLLNLQISAMHLHMRRIHPQIDIYIYLHIHLYIYIYTTGKPLLMQPAENYLRDAMNLVKDKFLHTTTLDATKMFFTCLQPVTHFRPHL